MSRLKKILIGLVIFFFLFTIFGFFIFPPLVKSILTKKLSENLHREVSIQRIKFNPYTISLTINGFLIKERSGQEPFFSFRELFINLQSLSVPKRALILKEIRITDPYFKIIRQKETAYNFSDLTETKAPQQETKPPPPEKKEKPFWFSINNIKIVNGSIDFDDQPKGIKHTVKDLNISIPFVSNITYYLNTYVQPIFSAKINDTPYLLEGKTKPFANSRETTFDVKITDLDIPYYLAYAPIKTNFKILSGFFDTTLVISFLQPKDKSPSLTLSGQMALKKFSVKDGENNPLLELPLLDIAIGPTEPLTKNIHLTKLLIQSPQLNVRQNQAGVLNITTLLPETKGKEPPSPPPPKKEENPLPLSIEIDEIHLAEGKVVFTDLSKGKSFQTTLNPVELKIGGFSNGKDKKTAYDLMFKTEAKEEIKLQGELSLDPLQVEGMVETKSIPLKKYSPYYKDGILFDIADGKLDISTRYKYAKTGKEEDISLSKLSVSLNSLHLRKRGENEDFLQIPALSLKETDIDLTKKEIKAGNFLTQKGVLSLKRLKNGDLNVLTLFPTPPSTDTVSPKSPAKQPEKKQVEKPWLVSMKSFRLDGYKMKVEDQTTAQPLTLNMENINLRVENISTAKNNRANLSFSLLLEKNGTISTTGTVGIDPLFGNLKMDLKGIAIGLLQPYFTDKIKINVTDGNLATSGNVAWSQSGDKNLAVAFNGEASLSRFASVDKINADDFLKWESLSFSDIQAKTNPLSVDIKGISLTDFYVRLIMKPDGTLNLQDILEKGQAKTEPGPSPTPSSPAPAAPQPAQKEKAAPSNIKIESITLQGGKIDFSDKSVNPNFSAKLSEIGGRISGLSSEETTLADMEMRGKYEDYAPLEITGKINPLKEDLYVDIKAQFKDIDLSPMSPYSGKYVGYITEKGKLSFNLQYLIVKKKLDSKNEIFIDQLTFGDKVESPNATKLPVKLAIALLKNRKGEIRLDIPVQGSLDDPKFSIGKIILQVLLNLISKAATSPFALLGAVFGGGEELNYLEFDYGRTIITEPNQKKVETLIKALHERPALKLDIEGHVDMDKDREGLKDYLFNKKLKAQRLNEIIKQGLPVVPVDEIKIETQDYGKYLKMAYKAETFPKPKNILGIPKDLPVPEMEKLMLTHLEIKNDDLRALASQRAQKVKETIITSKLVEPERIFIVEPKTLAPEKKEKSKDSRVDFKLK